MENIPTEISKTTQVLRWTAVLPGAILAVLLVAFPIHWLVVFLQIPSSESSVTDGKGNPVSILSLIGTENLEYLAMALINPIVVILAGSHIAPKYKFNTGIALAILWGVGMGASFAFILLEKQVEGWNWLRLTLTGLFGLAGISIGLYQSHKLELNSKNKK